MKFIEIKSQKIEIGFLLILFFLSFSVFFKGESGFAEAEREETESLLTFNSEFALLKKKLLEVEGSIRDLDQEINQIRENLSISLIKKSKNFEIKFLEIFLDGDLWYRQKLNRQDNIALENNPVGKIIKRLFWERGGRKKSKLTLRCFYSPKQGEKAREEYQRSKSFEIAARTRVSNLLSIIINEKEEPQINPEDRLDLQINFW